ncbi:uncharacterized protein LOC133175660 [Saccostrea echinata]|uniref:uncharacterized protein LOC133175660 n=1 Tax=Saccostrea echinata TaxID=191078 RepID=UPI002A83E5DF|nr:uncharacterized protein LOC133175660 [Saccostrea echinata]
MKVKLGVIVYVFFVLIVKGSSSQPIVRHGTYGTIESPSFPKNYSNNLNITWETYGPIDAISLMVTILQFDVYYDPRFPCQDLLTITEVETNFDFFNRCGTIPKTNYILLGNKLKFTFRTDGENNAQGFRIHWEVRDYRKEGKDPIVKVLFCPPFPVTARSPLTTEASKLANEPTEHIEKLLYCQTSTISYIKDGVIGVLSTALLVVTVAFCCHRRKSSPPENKTEYSISYTSSEFSSLETETQTVYDYPLALTTEAVDNFSRSTTSSGYAIPTPYSPDGNETPIYGNMTIESENVNTNVECEYMNISMVIRPDVGKGEKSGKRSLHLDNSLSRNAVFSSKQSAQKRVNRPRNKRSKSKKVEENNYLNVTPKPHSYIEVVGDGTEALLCNSFTSMTSSGYSKPVENKTKQRRRLQCSNKKNTARRNVAVNS